MYIYTHIHTNLSVLSNKIILYNLFFTSKNNKILLVASETILKIFLFYFPENMYEIYGATIITCNLLWSKDAKTIINNKKKLNASFY